MTYPVLQPRSVRLPGGEPVYEAVPESSGGAVPADHGLSSWTFDLIHAGGAIQLTAGVMYLCELTVRERVSVEKIWAGLSAPGSGMVNGQNSYSLYGPTGARLGMTDDQTVSFSNVVDWGVKSPTLTTPVIIDPARYWVGVLGNGASMPSFARAGFAAVAGMPNANLAAATARFGTYGSGLTTPPASIAPGAIARDDAATLWIGISGTAQA